MNNRFAPTFPNETLVGTLAPLRLIEITNAYNLAFFDVHLGGAPETELTGLAERLPEVRFAATQSRVSDRTSD